LRKTRTRRQRQLTCISTHVVYQRTTAIGCAAVGGGKNLRKDLEMSTYLCQYSSRVPAHENCAVGGGKNLRKIWRRQLRQLTFLTRFALWASTIAHVTLFRRCGWRRLWKRRSGEEIRSPRSMVVFVYSNKHIM
jgi:hypothetical protein